MRAEVLKALGGDPLMVLDDASMVYKDMYGKVAPAAYRRLFEAYERSMDALPGKGWCANINLVSTLNPKQVGLIFDTKAAPGGGTTESRGSPLELAVSVDALAVVDVLLDCGASVDPTPGSSLEPSNVHDALASKRFFEYAQS